VPKKPITHLRRELPGRTSETKYGHKAKEESAGRKFYYHKKDKLPPKVIFAIFTFWGILFTKIGAAIKE